MNWLPSKRFKREFRDGEKRLKAWECSKCGDVVLSEAKPKEKCESCEK